MGETKRIRVSNNEKLVKKKDRTKYIKAINSSMQ